MARPKVSDILQRFTSRKFLLALITAIVAFGNFYWEWGISVEEVLLIIAPILAFIGLEGWKDIKAVK